MCLVRAAVSSSSLFSPDFSRRRLPSIATRRRLHLKPPPRRYHSPPLACKPSRRRRSLLAATRRRSKPQPCALAPTRRRFSPAPAPPSRQPRAPPCSTPSTPQPQHHAAAAAPRRSRIRSILLAKCSPGARRFACAGTFAPRSCSAHRQSRWVAKRGRGRRSWSRSPLASGLVQRRRPRGPSWWPRPPRSRHQAMLVHSRSGRTPEAEADAGVWAE